MRNLNDLNNNDNRATTKHRNKVRKPEFIFDKIRHFKKQKYLHVLLI